MDAPAPSGLTTARVVALALMGLVVLGLTALHLVPGSEPLFVPEGAEAGDLRLEACTYPTENGEYEADAARSSFPRTTPTRGRGCSPCQWCASTPAQRIRASRFSAWRAAPA